ncbi:hypothetical protein J0H58_16820 [bacterium]|nr:hypothetical protein [bacterium]
MRLIKGPPPVSRTLDAREAGWHLLAEPGAGRFTAQALLLAAPLLAAAFVVLVDSKPFLKSEPAALAALLAFFAAMVPAHEIVHALAYPRGSGPSTSSSGRGRGGDWSTSSTTRLSRGAA